MNILDYIPYGKDNAIKRHELSAMFNLCDRDMRIAIEQLRKDNVILANYENGGYYRPTDRAEVKHALMVETRRMFSIHRNIETMKKYLRCTHG